MLKKRSICSTESAPKDAEEDSKKINFEARVEKAKAVSLNKEIAKFARQKDLTSAKESFEIALTNEWTNSHTFSAIINAHVRCGDIDGARTMYELMKKTKNVRIDVVSCTTLMKGFCSIGDMASCDGIIRDMVKSNPPISPNIRSVNTYFRGCLMTGSVCGAERMLARMQSDFRVPPDISSWEYVVALLCQALLLDKALPMIGRLKGDRSNSGGVGAMFVNLARAGALLGELKACKKALKQAEECLNADEELQMAEEADAAVDDEGSDYDSGSSEAGDDTGNSEHSRATLGGKRAWKLEEDDARAQSLEIYKEHRRAELRQELETISAYISKNGQCSVTRVLDYYGRVFSFDLQSTSSDTRNSLVDTLLLARVSKFGLAAALTKKCTAVTSMAAEGMVDYNIRRALGQPAAATLAVEASHTLPVRTEEMSAKDKDKAMRAKKKAKEKKKAAAATAALLESASPATCIKVAPAVALEIDGVRSHLTECVDEFGRLVFSKIFSNSCSPESGDGADSPRELPVKLEICSGGGEWAVKQAVADMGTANWITAEIRHDRVYQTFTRAVFEGASNLAVFGGDANEILARRIPAESLHFVCVNYPEPPQQLGGDSSQGKHLLTAEFFSAVENVLMPDGICTVVTDNLWYGKLILRTVAAMSFSSGLSNAVLSLDSQREVQEEASGYVLHKGKPGPECGHVTDASSYFDRLWKRGRQTDRYFLTLKKGPGRGPRGVALVGVSNITKRSGVGLPRVGGGKKIKFDN